MEIFIVLFGLLYFVPMFVAYGRHHNNSAPIAAVNILLGWTFLGWVAALVWALTNDVQSKEHDENVWRNKTSGFTGECTEADLEYQKKAS